MRTAVLFVSFWITVVLLISAMVIGIGSADAASFGRVGGFSGGFRAPSVRPSMPSYRPSVSVPSVKPSVPKPSAPAPTWNRSTPSYNSYSSPSTSWLPWFLLFWSMNNNSHAAAVPAGSSPSVETQPQPVCFDESCKTEK
jgi:hypothetical protein